MSEKVLNLALSWTPCHDTLTCDHWAWSPVEVLQIAVSFTVCLCSCPNVFVSWCRIYLQKSWSRWGKTFNILSLHYNLLILCQNRLTNYMFFICFTQRPTTFIHSNWTRTQLKWTCVHLGCLWLTEVRSLAYPQITKSYESEGLIIAMSTTSLPSTPCCGSSAAL